MALASPNRPEGRGCRRSRRHSCRDPGLGWSASPGAEQATGDCHKPDRHIDHPTSVNFVAGCDNGAHDNGADRHCDSVYGDCTSPSVEPAEIVLTCADYGEVLMGLHWTNWTATSASAVGTLVYNDCIPDCATGQHHSVPGTTVTLTVPIRGAGGTLVWSEVQENPEPPGYATRPYHGGPQPLPTQPN
jgi:hypothetical protein